MSIPYVSFLCLVWMKLTISPSRTTAVTASVLAEYKCMINNTTLDLEEHLQEIDQKLHNLSTQGTSVSSKEEDERDRVQEERDSTHQEVLWLNVAMDHILEVYILETME